MADRGARTAEREGDLVRRLAERVRSGEADPKRVAMAAWLGYGPALAVTEPEPPVWQPPGKEVSARKRIELVLVLGKLPGRTLVSLACDFASRVRPTNTPSADSALAAARAWVACPCSSHRIAAEHAAGWLDERVGPGAYDYDLALDAIHSATWAASADEDQDLRKRVLWTSNTAEVLDPDDADAWQANRVAEALCWGVEGLAPVEPIRLVSP
jgi:hypothetical protein